jgi:hypothetical protein
MFTAQLSITKIPCVSAILKIPYKVFKYKRNSFYVFTQSHVQAGVTYMILMHIPGFNKQYHIHAVPVPTVIAVAKRVLLFFPLLLLLYL